MPVLKLILGHVQDKMSQISTVLDYIDFSPPQGYEKGQEAMKRIKFAMKHDILHEFLGFW